MIGQHFQDAFLMSNYRWCFSLNVCRFPTYIYIFFFWILRVLLYIYIYQVSLLWFLSFSINSEMFGQKLFFTILIYFDLYILIMFPWWAKWRSMAALPLWTAPAARGSASTQLDQRTFLGGVKLLGWWIFMAFHRIPCDFMVDVQWVLYGFMVNLWNSWVINLSLCVDLWRIDGLTLWWVWIPMRLGAEYLTLFDQ